MAGSQARGAFPGREGGKTVRESARNLKMSGVGGPGLPRRVNSGTAPPVYRRVASLDGLFDFHRHYFGRGPWTSAVQGQK